MKALPIVKYKFVHKFVCDKLHFFFIFSLKMSTIYDESTKCDLSLSGFWELQLYKVSQFILVLGTGRYQGKVPQNFVWSSHNADISSVFLPFSKNPELLYLLTSVLLCIWLLLMCLQFRLICKIAFYWCS